MRRKRNESEKFNWREPLDKFFNDNQNFSGLLWRIGLTLILSLGILLLGCILLYIVTENNNSTYNVVAAEIEQGDVVIIKLRAALVKHEQELLQTDVETETETETEPVTEMQVVETESETETETETEEVVLRTVEFEDWEYDEFLRVVEAEVTSDHPAGVDYDTAVQCKLHVAQVIVNRIKSPAWPNTMHDVIFQTDAFTPTQDGRFWSVEVTQSTRDACYLAICDTTPDTVYGAQYFVAGTSSFFGSYVFTDEVGHSFFYQEV